MLLKAKVLQPPAFRASELGTDDDPCLLEVSRSDANRTRQTGRIFR